MTLLQRYIEAVKRYLPPASREDTGNELTGLLQEGLDEAAERRGRPLDDADVAEFLREYGHPYRVAARYRKRRALIDEAVYPLYKRVLAVMLSFLLLTGVVIALGRVGTSADAATAVATIPLFINDVLGSLLFGFALVTLGFHWFGDRIADNARLWRFDPAALPAIDADWANVRVAPTAWNIVLLVLGIALLQGLHHPWDGGDVAVRLNPTAQSYLLPLQLIALGMLAVHIVNLFQRWWTRAKLYALVALRALAALILLRLLFVPQLLAVAVADRGAARFMDWWPGVWVKLFLAAVIVHQGYRAYVALRRAKAETLPAL